MIQMTFIIEGRRGQAQTDPGAMEVLTMLYDFDKPTDRRHSNSLKWDIAEGELPMWVADMDFETAPAVRKALEDRTAHGIFGYSTVPGRVPWYTGTGPMRSIFRIWRKSSGILRRLL